MTTVQYREGWRDRLKRNTIKEGKYKGKCRICGEAKQSLAHLKKEHSYNYHIWIKPLRMYSKIGK